MSHRLIFLDQSHNVGNTAVTVVNSRRLATSYAINEKSRAWPPSRRVLIVGPSSRAPRLATVTLLMINARPDDILDPIRRSNVQLGSDSSETVHRFCWFEQLTAVAGRRGGTRTTSNGSRATPLIARKETMRLIYPSGYKILPEMTVSSKTLPLRFTRRG